MALSMNIGFGEGNEYMAEAESIMKTEQAKKRAAAAAAGGGGGGGGNPIAVVLDLLGVGRQVALPPEGESSETGDLASTPAAPTSQTTAVTDKSGDVIGQVEQAVSQFGNSTDVQRLPMAPFELPSLSGRGIPAPLTRIDPTTGMLR